MTNRQEGEFLEHRPCPNEDCGSSDAFAVYRKPDGTVDGYCWSCETYRKLEGDDEDSEGVEEKVVSNRIEDISGFINLKDRKINKDVAKLYGVRASVDEQTGEIKYHYYPYYRDGKFTGWKIREVETKGFDAKGNLKGNIQLFGQNVCGDGGKMLIITEGECDAMAAYQMFLSKGKRYRVCSLPNGASLKAFKNNLEWIEKFNTVVLCFDMDKAGQKAAQKASELLSPGKAKIMALPLKDANEMLLEGMSSEFYKALFDARQVRPDGIVSGGDTWERIKNRPKVKSVPYPWEGLNKKTYGIRIGELDTWTAGSGSGKTQIMRELEYHLLNSTEDSVGIIKLEESLEDSVEALMGIHLSKRINLPDIRDKVSEEELYQAWLATSGTNRLHYYDHFGSVDEESLIAKIRYLARGLNCKYIILDHLSIVISEFASEGGERERIDTAMTKLKRLTQELGIWIGLVVHLRKVSGGGKSFEEGAVPSLDDLRGSGSIKQLSNSVFTIARNQQAKDEYTRNTSEVHVLKCRFTGRTGKAGYLHYDDDSGRMIEVEEPEIVNESEEF